jgi:hypothetical protein
MLQFYITASPICFSSQQAIIRDTNMRENASRRAGRSSKQRQSRSNREAEAKNGRQSRTPVWVEVGRIILARGSGRNRKAGRQAARQRGVGYAEAGR